VTLGIPIGSKSAPDWQDIEVKCLTFERNLKQGTDLTLVTRTPDWEKLRTFGITQASFFHQIDYSYIHRGRSLFFTRRLRYIVSRDSRSIDWYVVPEGFPPTEPYSKAPANVGTHVFSWKIEELLGKIRRLSITLVKKKGNYPSGTITPARSYVVNMFQEKFTELLYEGSIRYELRRSPEKGFSILWNKTETEASKKYGGHPCRDSWEWADSEFEKSGGKWHDHGTGFRLRRPVLNSLLALVDEILPK